MITISFLLALLLGLSPQQEKPTVEVYNVEKEGSVEVHARNLNPYPVTLELKIELENLRSSKRLPLTQVLAPGSDVELLELTSKNSKEKWGFSSNYTYFMGSIFAEHTDSYAYRLPYKLGTEAMVAQAYHGDFSHSGRIAYSIDFNMDEGTEIYAARSGVVVDFKESFTEGGSDEFYLDKANYVTVVHNDGTFSEYAHLKVNGVVVNIGQKVRVGQLLAYSGATGYVTGPHLHFNVKKVARDGSFNTLPVKFRTQNGAIQLKEKERYKAL